MGGEMKNEIPWKAKSFSAFVEMRRCHEITNFFTLSH
jgi:hypothetical protein